MVDLNYQPTQKPVTSYQIPLQILQKKIYTNKINQYSPYSSVINFNTINMFLFMKGKLLAKRVSGIFIPETAFLNYSFF